MTSSPSTPPEAPKPETMDLRALIIDAMRDAWNDICSDTNCHPDDISHEGRRLFFEPGHWASQTADIVVSKIEAVSAALSAKPETDFETWADNVEPGLSEIERGAAAEAWQAAHTALSAKPETDFETLARKAVDDVWYALQYGRTHAKAHFVLTFAATLEAAHTALSARLAEVERERDEAIANTRIKLQEAHVARDRREADLQSKAMRYEAAFKVARERTAHLRAEWAAEPWKSTPGSFFDMNSQNTRDALATFAYDVSTAETALATVRGQLAEADAVIATVWLDKTIDASIESRDAALARHKARAAGKGTGS